MSKRQTAVLAALQAGSLFGITTSDIGTSIGAPEASVRRTIQELIAQGYNISYAANGLYYYRAGY